MELYICIAITVVAIIAVATCLLLVVIELHQAATARKTIEQKMLETKLELRRLRRDLLSAGRDRRLTS